MKRRAIRSVGAATGDKSHQPQSVADILSAIEALSPEDRASLIETLDLRMADEVGYELGELATHMTNAYFSAVKVAFNAIYKASEIWHVWSELRVKYNRLCRRKRRDEMFEAIRQEIAAGSAKRWKDRFAELKAENRKSIAGIRSAKSLKAQYHRWLKTGPDDPYDPGPFWPPPGLDETLERLNAVPELRLPSRN